MNISQHRIVGLTPSTHTLEVVLALPLLLSIAMHEDLKTSGRYRVVSDALVAGLVTRYPPFEASLK